MGRGLLYQDTIISEDHKAGLFVIKNIFMLAGDLPR